jgi:hypothetical protein
MLPETLQKRAKRMRDKVIKVRVSTDEFNQLSGLKTEIRLASWMRKKCLDQSCFVSRVDQNLVLKSDPELIRQLASIGNNINQIAKSINFSDLSSLYRLSDIQKKLDELLYAHQTF